MERLPTGHVSKTPVPNPYSPRSEQNARDKMEREYQVYRVLGYGNPFVPRLIDWDEESKTLTLEDHRNGDLERYMKEHAADVDPETRRKWALQAAQALESLHRRQVIHHDVTPRNFLLNDDLDLRICDFAGSSFPGHTASWGAPGERYQSRPWTRGYVPTVADDVFALGSVLFYIASGKEPYAELEDEEVEARFGKQDFPSCGELDCAAVIHGCWSGRFDDVKQVVEALS